MSSAKCCSFGLGLNVLNVFRELMKKINKMLESYVCAESQL